MVKARPFLRWAGGKGQLLPELKGRVPKSYGTYFEPFLGGGALFFELAPVTAVLGDINLALITAYRGIRTHVEDVISILKGYAIRHCEGEYYAVRAARPDLDQTAAFAAWFIYLNKTCFNGLHRVNKAGGFNVPYGKIKKPQICDEANLRACSTALQGVDLICAPFKETTAEAAVGDLVYFDPPYVPLHEASFTAYAKEGFGPGDQVALRDHCRVLKAKGVSVMVSNSGAPYVEELYGDDFSLDEVAARRNINSKASARGPVKEYIIR